jgi:hypothetical protein
MAPAKPTGSLTRHGPVRRPATVVKEAASAGRDIPPRALAAGWREMAAARARGSVREASDEGMPVPYGPGVTTKGTNVRTVQ